MANYSDSNNKKLKDKLLLDVERGEYARELELNELWQKDAYHKICDLLKDGINEIGKQSG